VKTQLLSVAGTNIARDNQSAVRYNFFFHVKAGIILVPEGGWCIADHWVARFTMMADGGIARFDVLGIKVSALDIPIAIHEIERWIRQGYRSYATLTGVHGIMESVRSEEVRRAHNEAGLVLPDGMPLVWLLRWSGFKSADRVYGPDLMPALFNQSEQSGYRHFLYGSTPHTLELLKGKLKREFPRAEIVGVHAPPFRPAGADEDEAVIEGINESAAHIIWVGLSTPKQEMWMARHRHRLLAPALIGVGAAFNFHAGVLRQAPRWLQRSGLEWAYRTAVEPRRLARRYLRNNPAFLTLLAAQKLGFGTTKKVTSADDYDIL
jgi:N-acetylglucosaminyldiphosphoundecaprenol N-acetyl-beta-D-mannosaminyltransferase